MHKLRSSMDVSVDKTQKPRKQTRSLHLFLHQRHFKALSRVLFSLSLLLLHSGLVIVRSRFFSPEERNDDTPLKTKQGF